MQSPSRLNQLSANITVEHTTPGTAMFFDDISSAARWLHEASQP